MACEDGKKTPGRKNNVSGGPKAGRGLGSYRNGKEAGDRNDKRTRGCGGSREPGKEHHEHHGPTVEKGCVQCSSAPRTSGTAVCAHPLWRVAPVQAVLPSCYNIPEAAKGLGLSSSPARWENNFDCPPGLSGVWQLTQANCSTQRLLFCPSSLGSLFSLPPRDSGIR